MLAQKIGTISLYALTSSNINRFSKLFHCQNQLTYKEIVDFLGHFVLSISFVSLALSSVVFTARHGRIMIRELMCYTLVTSSVNDIIVHDYWLLVL